MKNTKNIWYAVMSDREDSDWGTGSYSLAIAKDMARSYRAAGDTEAYIAVIEEGDDPVAIDEITELDD